LSWNCSRRHWKSKKVSESNMMCLSSECWCRTSPTHVHSTAAAVSLRAAQSTWATPAHFDDLIVAGNATGIKKRWVRLMDMCLLCCCECCVSPIHPASLLLLLVRWQLYRLPPP
jgi:hypothetical protein